MTEDARPLDRIAWLVEKLEQAINAAYTDGKHGAFFRDGGREYVPSPHRVVDELKVLVKRLRATVAPPQELTPADFIPPEVQQELMACAAANGRIRYAYLCDIYVRGVGRGLARSAVVEPPAPEKET